MAKHMQDFKYVYVPEYCKNISVIYHIINFGEPAEQFYPGCEPEIEIVSIMINHKDASEYLYDHLMRTHEFEQEIINELKKGPQ